MDDKLMTYAEMAEAFEIKLSSAKKLAQRKKWPRVLGNDGLAKVRVPISAVSGARGAERVADDLEEMSPPVSPHNAEFLDALRGQVEAERRRADAAEARIKDLEADRDAWRAQAQRSLWVRLFGR